VGGVLDHLGGIPAAGQPDQPALVVVSGAQAGAAERVDDLVQVVGPGRVVDEPGRVAVPVGDGNQVALVVVLIPHPVAVRVNDSTDPPLGGALEGNLLPGRADDAGVAESQGVAVGIEDAAELARRRVDLVRHALLGRQRVDGPGSGMPSPARKSGASATECKS
jgi:hypothetical protein